jgi:SAM-dependent methyltransferase
VLAEYARAMRVLYRKEFASPAAGDAQALLEYVAGLYRERGHSTDSQVESGFAVQQALAVIRAEADHGPLDRVLIVGPGLDFAPRTDLVDLFEPRSYQPFAVGDALLGLRLASSERLRIHCVDISPRVVAYLAGLPKDAPTALPLVSGLAERADRPFSADYREYFAGLGKSVGKERPLVLPAGFEGRLSKRLEVRREFAERLTAERLDVVTERHDPPPVCDLVVVTNVFSYFDPPQQALALANVASTLRKGGYLVHNEPQSALVAAAEALGLSLVQARSVLLASHPREPFFDRVVIHRRTR